MCPVVYGGLDYQRDRKPVNGWGWYLMMAQLWSLMMLLTLLQTLVLPGEALVLAGLTRLLQGVSFVLLSAAAMRGQQACLARDPKLCSLFLFSHRCAHHYQRQARHFWCVASGILYVNSMSRVIS